MDTSESAARYWFMMISIVKLQYSCTETFIYTGRGFVATYSNITHFISLVMYDGNTDVFYHRPRNYTTVYMQEEELQIPILYVDSQVYGQTNHFGAVVSRLQGSQVSDLSDGVSPEGRFCSAACD